MEEAEKIQQICAVEDDILHQQFKNIDDKVNKMIENQQKPLSESQKLMDDMRREFKNQMETVTKTMESGNPNMEALWAEIAVLRRDYNNLLETRSLVQSPIKAKNSNVEEDVNRAQMLENSQPTSEKAEKLEDQPPPGVQNNQPQILSGHAQPWRHQHSNSQNYQSDSQQQQPIPVHRPDQQQYDFRLQPPRSVIDVSSDDEDPLFNNRQHERYDSSDEDDTDSKIPFFKRDKGPRYRNLTTIKPSDPLFAAWWITDTIGYYWHHTEEMWMLFWIFKNEWIR